ncbi:SRPBCC family protein [Actinomadura sp. DC4]|uniref:SRPBCC family protein n=1 Tax=Actinomadura sp. DC4 TaxID=3055069 RepID=UPI0025B13AAA|nr:SRPBCC family protein [Actinomadura sp. DC4]MDN3356158.1 SRPBCC family protein [Actinomadura sp. DC4]
MNGSLHTAGGRNVLRFERRLAHPVEKVWRAVTEPAELAHWFPAMVAMEPRVGGAMRFTFPGGEMDPTDGTVTELDPPRVFAFVWAGDPLRIELAPDGEGTLLTFTYTFQDRPMAGSYATGWHTCLDALAHALAGTAPQEPAPYPERHDAFVEEFGLGEGTAGEDGTVRFERLLPHPAEKVWAALTGPDAPATGGEPPLPVTNGYVPAGPLTEVETGTVLEYAWLSDGVPAGRVRWELTGGHPAGTRVVLTQTRPGDRTTALAAWHTQLEILADHLRGVTRCPWPKERTEELRRHYERVAR